MWNGSDLMASGFRGPSRTRARRCRSPNSRLSVLSSQGANGRSGLNVLVRSVLMIPAVAEEVWLSMVAASRSMLTPRSSSTGGGKWRAAVGLKVPNCLAVDESAMLDLGIEGSRGTAMRNMDAMEVWKAGLAGCAHDVVRAWRGVNVDRPAQDNATQEGSHPGKEGGTKIRGGKEAV